MKNERWRHHKGNIYLVEGMARDHETRREMVIYRREGSDPSDLPESRSLESWLEEVRPGVARYVRLQSRPETQGS